MMHTASVLQLVTMMLRSKRIFVGRPALQSILSIALLRLYTPAAVMTVGAYPIGVPGVAWGPKERAEWMSSRKLQRSYQEEVVSKLSTDIDGFITQQYGTLTVGGVNKEEDGYPLLVAKSKNWEANNKPSILITGGVHGYETSGVQGAIQFLKTNSETFNVVVVPCVSPWGYEVIERWNAQAVDPNRSFNPQGEVVQGRSFNPEAATQESTALIEYLKSLEIEQWMCHFDLHETTNTDKTEFRPAKRARDGEILQPREDDEGDDEDPDAIPDGFYLVSDSTNPQAEWHAAMIDSVRQVSLLND
jgi:hypothetical protein